MTLPLSPIAFVVAVLCTHYVADFLLQSQWMAENKSKRMLPLVLHVSVYGLGLLWIGWKFAIANALLHGVVDFCTSRWMSRLHAAGQIRSFFMVLGLDQLAHHTCLMLTLGLSWWRLFP